MPNGMTLDELNVSVESGMTEAEVDLRATIDGVKTGTSISVPDMINLQFKMSQYTITASIFSSLMKELTDTMKSVVQKIS
ncbi:MAG: Type secretion needle MxiH, YscF, SsaG, EprI, PscF, EscF [Herminiimonas sp.]|nr:Type secretion needle MxiH, YscF, SsaG, EprI, PscF, EscF [Herminiimonas sp.]